MEARPDSGGRDTPHSDGAAHRGGEREVRGRTDDAPGGAAAVPVLSAARAA
ncbi:hypothetical protein LguiA_000677 [Lonicera macranthoides]